MKTLVEYLASRAETRPDALFAADGAGGRLTNEEAWALARRMAGAMASGSGVKAGDPVVARCAQRVEYLALCMACNLLGAVFVPLEEKASGERKLEILQETGAVLYVSMAEEETGIPAVTYAALREMDAPLCPVSFPPEDSVSEILYTTGTTGKSKGIVITHRANIALAENVRCGVSMRPDSVEMIPLAMSHSHGLRTFYANLLNGGGVVVTDGVVKIKALFELMDRERVTALDLSPSAAQFLIRLGRDAFWEKARALDYIEIGTAALPEELKEELIAHLPGVRLYNFYGSTESGRTCVLDFSQERDRKKCIGKPTKNAEIIFTDEQRHPVAATGEQPGLLASRGPMNMTGYFRSEELTREVLIDGFVCTNDMGYMDEQGFVFVLGRLDDVINCSGIKISPGEIEDIALQVPGVAEAACVGKADPTAGAIPWLYVVAKEGSVLSAEELQAFLGQRIERGKMPRTVEVIEELPRTYNGKINRKELAKR